MPDDPENLGLAALMLLQDSRRDARMNERGELVTLEDQERSRWDDGKIEEGLLLLEKALRSRTAGPYQLQAAIAAVHARSRTAGETDWPQIAALYKELLRIEPSPIVALNHAVAVAMSEGFEKGLTEIDEAGAGGTLDQYHLFHAARADLLRRLGRKHEAAVAYTRALALTTNQIEQQYLRRRLGEVTSGGK
jgi:RNA polymerase sigma-70 factor (ECF subfamily)